MKLELVTDDKVEILLVDGIVIAKSGCVVIIDHGLVAVRDVIAAGVPDVCRYLALKLDVKRLDDVKPMVGSGGVRAGMRKSVAAWSAYL